MRWAIAFCITGLCWIGREIKFSDKPKYTKTIIHVTATPQESDSLTKENILKEINRLGISSPDIVLRQVILETGGLLCTDCSLNRNNLFGFATDKGYISFKNWRQSVAYYASWQIRKGYSGKGDYYEFLRRKWVCEDIDHYITQLRAMSSTKY